jgi:hypothetical protein
MPTDDSPGYRKPPKDSQFQKGTSGNPNGRPRESREIPEMLWRVLRKTVAVTENGTSKRKQKLELIMTQLVNRTAAGDVRALQHLLTLIRSFPEPSKAKREYEKLTDAEMEALIMGDLEKIKWPRRIR